MLVVGSGARMWGYTVDDAYISLRYARNLAGGHGLVYNPGEAVEGYSNFLWTVLAAVPHVLGIDPVSSTKALGLASALFALEGTRALAEAAGGGLPGAGLLALWLLASSTPFVGHAIFGLETAFVAALLVWGTVWVVREEREGRERAVPWRSGGLFAAAMLTRPDAPLWVGLAGLLLPRAPLGRRNLLRAALAAGPVAVHLVWRWYTYGHLVPNTLAAKTGDLHQQFVGGVRYLGGYALAHLPTSLLVLAGGLLAVRRGGRVLRFLAVSCLAWLGYVTCVGGDWMILWRFLAPMEPFAFALAAGVAVPWLARDRGRRKGAAAFAVLLVFFRAAALVTGWEKVDEERRAWAVMLDAPVDWLLRAPPGEVAFADLGYVGYVTNRPIFDLLGLMAPEIAGLEGGYTTKDGRGMAEAVVRRRPTYLFLLSYPNDCHHPLHHGMRALYEQPDGLLQRSYVLADVVPWYGEMVGCFWERAEATAPLRLRKVFSFEEDRLVGWRLSGDAWEDGPARGPRPGQGPVYGVEGQGFLDSFAPTKGDAARGVAVSPPFEIDRGFLAWRVGGGYLQGLAVRLVVDGEEIHRTTGRNTEGLDRIVMDVRNHRGRTARVVVEDREVGPWGHILLDDVSLFDLSGVPPPPPRETGR